MSLINVETLLAADHPTGAIKRICDEALAAMSSHFDEIYAADGAPQQKPLPRSRADSRARQYVVATWNLVRMAKLFGSPPGTARA